MSIAEDKTSRTVPGRPARKGWFAAGGVVGAFLATARCIGPLVLLTLGISGAWIGTLTARASGRSIPASPRSANPGPTARNRTLPGSPKP